MSPLLTFSRGNKDQITITAGTEGTYKPFSYHNTDGTLIGYDVEVAKAIASELGYDIEFVESRWDALLAGVKVGRWDLVANQVWWNESRNEEFLLSKPYMVAGASVLIRKENTATIAIIGFSLHVGAYASETIRTSLESAPYTLRETGLALGFTRHQNFWHILIPHAAFSAVPSLFNTLIDLIKSTSLASIILVPEIMRKAQEFAISTNKFLLVYIEAAAFYLIICLLLEWLQKHIEKKVKIERDQHSHEHRF